MKYQKEQYEDEKRREAALGARKKQQLREVLDRQLREQREAKELQVREKQDFEQGLLQRMKDKEEAEREKQLERKGKIIMQKQMRDIQLIEAKKRKEQEAQV